MKSSTRFLVGVALLAGTAALSSCAASSDRSSGAAHAHSDGATAQQASAEADEQAALARMMKLATPGAPHAKLMADVGTWDCTYTFRMSQDGAPQTAKGVTVAHAVLDGRYLWHDTQSDMLGTPVEGFQLLGYDNSSDEYTAIWGDSWSTWTVSSRGKEIAPGVIEMNGMLKEGDGERAFRMVLRENGPDERNAVMYALTPDHGETVVMEIKRTRRKEPPSSGTAR